MNQVDGRTRALAVCFSAVAGYVDAVGFLTSGGFFVSFMSGNTTRLGVGLTDGGAVAGLAAGLVVAFVVGVVLGASLGRVVETYRRSAILSLVTALLATALVLHVAGAGVLAVVPLALAMGAENTVFVEDGDVRIGLTYMTGALVKLGKRLTAALWGGDPFAWVPYLLLWAGLLAGAVIGAVAYGRFGMGALAAAVVVMGLLTVVVGAGERRGRRR